MKASFGKVEGAAVVGTWVVVFAVVPDTPTVVAAVLVGTAGVVPTAAVCDTMVVVACAVVVGSVVGPLAHHVLLGHVKQ